MKKRAMISLAVFLAISALSQATAEEKLSKPRSDEVVIVVRFVVDPAIDSDFFAHYVKFSVPGFKAKPDPSWKGKVPGNTVYIQVNEPQKSVKKAKQLYTGLLGDLNVAKVAIPKTREIEVDGATVYLVDSSFFFFNLPIMRKIVVPEGMNYVYLGTFVFNMKDEFFNIGSIDQFDEFDSAAKWVKDNYGPDAKLVRVNLLDLSDKK